MKIVENDFTSPCKWWHAVVLGLWTAELGSWLTWQWIPQHRRTYRPWRPFILHDPRPALRVSCYHHLHLRLSTRSGQLFPDGCVRFPAKFSRTYASAPSEEEGHCGNPRPHEMPGYQAPVLGHHRYCVRSNAYILWRGTFCVGTHEEIFGWKISLVN